MDSLIKYLNSVQQDGLNINVIYDIGANSGGWSALLREALPYSQFYLFEANHIHIQNFKKLNFPYFNCVLSSPDKKYVDFYFKNSSECTTGNSYYKENTIYYDNSTPLKVPCVTLESIVNEYKLPLPNLLKIDTQGSELDILKGFESFLDKIDLVYLECPIIEYNIGAPTIQDYINYMRSHNFIPTEIIEKYRQENVVIHIDIMFINNNVKELIYGKTNYSRPL